MGKKSSSASCEESKRLFQECLAAIPGLALINRSVTTSSIYCRMPDGYGLRIGDHRGKERYSYKYNLDIHLLNSAWVRQHNKVDGRDYWRFYAASVQALARECERQISLGRVKGSKAPS